MIVFDLICRDQHRFEGWFASGEDFTAQKSLGLLACPVCGGAHVEKLPAAKIRKQPEAAMPAQTSVAEARETERIDVSRFIDYVLTHSEDVGTRFAEEARKIHYQQTTQRSIRGVTTRTEAEDLHEEGIPVFSLPIPPQDRWN
ncbi:MAG: DUF1178 family protein [Pseudomonadota bacterium]